MNITIFNTGLRTPDGHSLHTIYHYKFGYITDKCTIWSSRNRERIQIPLIEAIKVLFQYQPTAKFAKAEFGRYYFHG